MSKLRKPIEKTTKDIIYSCFKCQFIDISEINLEEHMKMEHLMGKVQFNAMNKFISKSNPQLLISTLHSDSEDSEDIRMKRTESWVN